MADANGSDTSKLVDKIIKTGLELALDEIPVVGSLLASIVDFLWPTDSSGVLSIDDIWSQLRVNVQTVAQEAVDAATFTRLRTLLGNQSDETGLAGDLVNFLGDPQTYFGGVASSFTTASAEFFPDDQSTQDKLILLAVQFAVLHLAFLRQGTTGTGTAAAADAARQLTDRTVFYKYALLASYVRCVDALQKKTAADPNMPPPKGFDNAQSWSMGIRSLNTNVLDYLDVMPYFDTSKYPPSTLSNIQFSNNWRLFFVRESPVQQGFANDLSLSLYPPDILSAPIRSDLVSVDIYRSWLLSTSEFRLIGTQCRFANGDVGPYSGALLDGGNPPSWLPPGTAKPLRGWQDYCYTVANVPLGDPCACASVAFAFTENAFTGNTTDANGLSVVPGTVHGLAFLLSDPTSG
ncbi:MAG TPA: hypothetical protein VMU33_12300 [Burkholderiaceae bacterium]|nr:hypothetical protein [Burkholderiaceae bacterium]